MLEQKLQTKKRGRGRPKGSKGENINAPKVPIVIAFKTSNRSNAKYKLKVYKNKTIDEINTAKKLPGIPEDSSLILEIGVGKVFIKKFSIKYKIGNYEKYKKEFVKKYYSREDVLKLMNASFKLGKKSNDKEFKQLFNLI